MSRGGLPAHLFYFLDFYNILVSLWLLALLWNCISICQSPACCWVMSGRLVLRRDCRDQAGDPKDSNNDLTLTSRAVTSRRELLTSSSPVFRILYFCWVLLTQKCLNITNSAWLLKWSRTSFPLHWLNSIEFTRHNPPNPERKKIKKRVEMFVYEHMEACTPLTLSMSLLPPYSFITLIWFSVPKLDQLSVLS